MTPLEQLVESLEMRGETPPGWRARHAPDGDLRALWDTSEQPGVLYRLATPPDQVAAASTPAIECASVAIDLAQLQGTPWAGFVEKLRRHEEYADSLLDEAEPLLNEESPLASARVHLAMTVVYRMLLAEDYQHTEDPVRAGLGAVEAAAQLEQTVSGAGCPRVLHAVRGALVCPTLDAAIARYVASGRGEPN